MNVSAAPSSIPIEIAYATPQRQILFCMRVPADWTIEKILKHSPLFSAPPLLEDINLHDCEWGCFAQRKALSDILLPGDRLELYRPLLIDPKAARLKKIKRK